MHPNGTDPFFNGTVLILYGTGIIPIGGVSSLKVCKYIVK
jgi:hypothetical protein